MGKRLLIFCLFILTHNLSAQTRSVESLKQALQNSHSEKEKIELWGELCVIFSNSYLDSALFYADRIIELSLQSGNRHGQALGYLYKGWALEHASNFSMALNMAYTSLRLAEGLKESRSDMIGRAYNLVGFLNAFMGKDSVAKQYLHQSIDLLYGDGGLGRQDPFTNPYSSLGFVFLLSGAKDSALYYGRKAYEADLLSDPELGRFQSLIVLGNVYKHKQIFDTSKYYYRQALDMAYELKAPFYQTILLVEMAGVYFDSGDTDSCIHYAKAALAIAQQYGYKLSEINAGSMLYFQYEQHLRQTDSAHKYLQVLVGAKDHVFNDSRLQQFQLYAFDEAQRLKDLEAQKKQIQTKVSMYAMLATIVVFAFIAFLLYRNNRQKQWANQMLEKTLAELKATQAQLIQSEKMASLGELTAGIAHEIQNPLNFVNNFSEINNELLDEMQEHWGTPDGVFYPGRESGEKHTGSSGQAGSPRNEKSMLLAIKKNQEKILAHGKRAEAIVKSMLQHSGQNAGTTNQKEATDLNALCGEYLRLAYHGLRGKDQEFKSGFNLDLDPVLPKIKAVQQEIGRVLLNLINNAFYSVQQRSKTDKTDYQPMVTISTKRMVQGVEIRVKDNGEGIPESIRQKIFQPFFTTKPAGQGTGLGLSLAYDIVTKGHGGSLKVVSEVGAGTEFIVELPI